VAADLLGPERAARTVLPQTHLSCGLCDRYAERGVAVQDGGADLQFWDLTIEAACHQALPRQFHAMHLCLGTVSAIVHSIFARVCVRGISRRFAPRSARWRLRSMSSMVWRFCAGEARPGVDPVDRFSPERTEPWCMTGSAPRSATASQHLRVSQAPSAVTVSSSSSAGIRSRSSGGASACPDAAPGGLDGSDLPRPLIRADVDLAPWTPLTLYRQARLDCGIAIQWRPALLAGGWRHPDHVRIEPDRQRATLLQRGRGLAPTKASSPAYYRLASSWPCSSKGGGCSCRPATMLHSPDESLTLSLRNKASGRCGVRHCECCSRGRYVRKSAQSRRGSAGCCR